MGGVAPGDATQDIGDSVGTRKGRAPPRRYIELPKAMKQIRTADLPYHSGDTDVRPGQRHTGPQTAIQGDLGQAEAAETPEEQPAQEAYEPRRSRGLRAHHRIPSLRDTSLSIPGRRRGLQWLGEGNGRDVGV